MKTRIQTSSRESKGQWLQDHIRAQANKHIALHCARPGKISYNWGTLAI